MTRDETEPEPPSLGPALDFLRTLWRLNHALERLSSRMDKTLGVTAQQRLALRCIGSLPGVGPGQLAELLHVDPGTISATLGRLEAKGLVRRRKDAHDRRRNTVVLTAAGRALDRPTAGTVEDAVEQFLRSGVDVAAAEGALRRLSSILDTAEPRRRSRR